MSSSFYNIDTIRITTLITLIKHQLYEGKITRRNRVVEFWKTRDCRLYQEFLLIVN